MGWLGLEWMGMGQRWVGLSVCLPVQATNPIPVLASFNVLEFDTDDERTQQSVITSVAVG